ncbi:MAG: hypothetical protein ABSB28_09025 [Candidatus Bathyarchaeia archaeon]
MTSETYAQGNEIIIVGADYNSTSTIETPDINITIPARIFIEYADYASVDARPTRTWNLHRQSRDHPGRGRKAYRFRLRIPLSRTGRS